MTLRYTTHRMPGGIHPPEQKRISNTVPIRPAPLPKQLIIPLGQHLGAEAEPSVRVGDTVLRGECIAKAGTGISAPVHATSSGKVTAIEPRPIQHPSGLSATCIIIDTDGEDNWHPKAQPKKPTYHFERDNQQLNQLVHQAGVVGLGGAGFPTAFKAKPQTQKNKQRQPIHTLILNAVECEPYITADDVSIRERSDEILVGCQWLTKITGANRVLIGIEDNKPEAITALKESIQRHRTRFNPMGPTPTFEIIVLPTKYPSGGEKQLIQLVTGLEVPQGQRPDTLGLLCVNVGTCYAVYLALSCQTPLTSRITTFTGQAIPSQARGNYEIRIGTPVVDVLNHLGADWSQVDRLVMGGPMMGYTLQSAHIPLVKTSNCIIAAPYAELPAPQPELPCIRCGFCAQVCPASLLPQQLYWYAKSQDEQGLEQQNLMDCIECGACSYVCPSHIPLVQYYRYGKGLIRQHTEEKRKSDHARMRFENRQARIEREQAEREAKRLARRKTLKKKPQPSAQPPQSKPTPASAKAPDTKTTKTTKTAPKMLDKSAPASLESPETKPQTSEKPELGNTDSKKHEITEPKLTQPKTPESELTEKASGSKSPDSPLASQPLESQALESLPTEAQSEKRQPAATQPEQITPDTAPVTQTTPSSQTDQATENATAPGEVTESNGLIEQNPVEEDPYLISLFNNYLKTRKRWQDAQKALKRWEKQMGSKPSSDSEDKLEKHQKKVQALKDQAEALYTQWEKAKQTANQAE